jgi:hypothetical protein
VGIRQSPPPWPADYTRQLWQRRFFKTRAFEPVPHPRVFCGVKNGGSFHRHGLDSCSVAARAGIGFGTTNPSLCIDFTCELALDANVTTSQSTLRGPARSRLSPSCQIVAAPILKTGHSRALHRPWPTWPVCVPWSADSATNTNCDSAVF